MQGPRLKLWAGFLSCLFFCLCEVASSKTLKCEQGSSFEEDVRRASVEDTTAINCKTKRFGGFIPTQIGLLTNVKKMSVQRNELRGHLPSELGRLTLLVDLDIRENHLSGTFPPQIGKLTLLSRLRIGRNQWNWTLPSTWTNLASLKKLGVSYAGLTEIPQVFLRLLSLESLVVKGNRIRQRIPTELGGLLQLTTLDLSENEFFGSIPEQLGRLQNLEEFKVVENRLSGSIPSEVGFWNQLKKLSLNDNLLVSTLPTELGLLTTLSEGLFQENGLSSTIPTYIGNMVGIRWLQLESNVFTGALPTELAKLTRLTFFRHDQTLFKSCELQLDSDIDGWETPAQCLVRNETNPVTASPTAATAPTSSPFATEATLSPTESRQAQPTISPTTGIPVNDDDVFPGSLVAAFVIALASCVGAGTYCCARYKKLKRLSGEATHRVNSSRASDNSEKIEEVALD